MRQDEKNSPGRKRNSPESRGQRRRQRLLEEAQKPLLPFAARLTFWFFLAATASFLAVEIRSYMTATAISPAAAAHALSNMSVTALSCSVIAALVLVPLCFAGLHCTAKKDAAGVLKESGAPGRKQEEGNDKIKGSPGRSYRIYLLVVLCMLAASAIFFLIAHV